MDSSMIIIAWIVGTTMNGMIADQKGRSVGWCVGCSILLTPLTVYCYLLAVPALPEKEAEKEEDMEKIRKYEKSINN